MLTNAVRSSAIDGPSPRHPALESRGGPYPVAVAYCSDLPLRSITLLNNRNGVSLLSMANNSKQFVGIRVEPELWRRVRMVALGLGVTAQEAVASALEAWVLTGPAPGLGGRPPGPRSAIIPEKRLPREPGPFPVSRPAVTWDEAIEDESRRHAAGERRYEKDEYSQ